MILMNMMGKSVYEGWILPYFSSFLPKVGLTRMHAVMT